MTRLVVFVFVCIFASCVAPPPRTRDDKPAAAEPKNVSENEVYDALELEYNRYLQEVVQALEGDEKFRKMLETVNPEDIKNGKIAQNLDMVSLNVRSKLDEIKRAEVERLRQLAMLEHERSQGLPGRIKVPGHVDYVRADSFGSEDLRKLMQQTHKDLEEADRKRKDEFKRYEMEKQFKFKEELEKLPEQEKEKLKQKHEEEVKKHKDHPRIHHPGSKQQLEEVWEKQDHLEPQDFNPKTLFYMHDLDGNGHLDQEEVKLLFHNEIRKAYNAESPEDDMHEMEEDLERMREHVFNESDANRDALISLDEFMAMVKKDDFEQDPEWHGVEDEDAFSEQEFMEYERLRREEMMRMGGGNMPPPGYHVPNPNEYYGYQGPPMPPHGGPQFQGQPPMPHPGQFQGQPPVPHSGQFQGQPPVPHSGQFQGQPQVPHQGQVPQHYQQQVPQNSGQYRGQDSGQFQDQNSGQYQAQQPVLQQNQPQGVQQQGQAQQQQQLPHAQVQQPQQPAAANAAPNAGQNQQQPGPAAPQPSQKVN